MIGLIVASVVVCILTIIVKGFGIIAITSIASTALFASRAVGHHCRFNSIIVWECVGIGLSLLVALMMKNVNVVEYAIVIALRLIHVAICMYDINNYVYVKKVVTRGEDVDLNK